MANEITINALNPNTFELQSYSTADANLIGEIQVDTSFSGSVTTGSITPDYIEFYIYDQNQNILFPTVGINTLINYEVRDGDVLLNPVNDLESYNYAEGTYNVLYNFFRKRLGSDNFATYYISEISSDRTEIRLDSNIIENEDIIITTNQFIEYRESQDYFVDFYLNFGQNQTIIANNIQLDDNDEDDPTILIKLYEPLPQQYNLKDELWVVEELSTPQAYQVNFPRAIVIEDDFTYLQGPNYSLNVRQETATSGEGFSFSTLLESNVTSSINQIKNLLNEKEININIDYENYSNFVHFSSAQTRLENFAYKAALIESASNQISAYLGQVTSDTTSSIAFSASLATLNSEIDTVIKNFDGYEAFLYFNSGSDYSWPKQNTEPPFVLFGTGSTEALEWLGSSDLTSSYYGGQALSASNYDQENRDWLYFSIPEYLRDDPQNERYELFTDMVGQYYDNIWVYTKDLTNKFDADNRLEFGISQDLVADAIRDFSVKLYASNFNTDDLFTAFLGLTPSGSLFPFPTITGSLNPPTGYEYVNDKISASNDVVPLNDTQKQLYKRIYHNIPLTLKKKGTVGAIRALITSYGIPDTILRINEFGGKDRNEAHDYDLKQHNFNYAFDTTTTATRFVSSSFDTVNSKFENYNGDNVPLCVQFRFKTAGIPTASNNVASSDIRYSQSLWIGKQGGSVTGSLLVLEYTGSGFTSASFSGSVPSIYDNYGTLKFIPGANNSPTLSASIYLPFFDGNWWSVQLNHTGSSTGANVTGSILAANQINGVIGFTGSSEILGYDARGWTRNDAVFLNTQSNIDFQGQFYEPFSGSFQEYRFWNQEISQSNFYDYTANPFSNEGNGVDSTPDQLIFRADLGTQLNTASRTSIHPRVTGSAVQITQSFTNDSNFFANGPYVINREYVYQDQVLAGIKNRISDKIQLENNILAEAPYGLSTPTSSTATIASGDTTTLSPIESIQQESYVSQSYTPSVDYLEVGFSTANQINDDINAQLGYFNLGDYIGDPRFQSSSDYTYPSLDILRNAYFEKYIKSYDIVDFIRLIKFFDNSLFKMIKDITPARTSLASGVIVKQHILERNRQRAAIASSSFHDYSGSIKPFPRDYNTGSSDFPQYSSTSGSSLVKVTGGAGGSFNRFNKICNNPFYSLNYLIPGSRITNVTASASPNDGIFVFEIDSTPNSTFYNKAYIEITQGDDVIKKVVIAQSASVAYNTETGETTGNVDATDLYQGLNIILGATTASNAIVIPEYVQQVAGMVDDLGEGDITIIFDTNNVGTYDSCDITYFAGDSHPQRYNLTQSWSESIENSVINSLLFNRSSSQFISASFGGYDTKLHSDQSEFYDGIFSGSNLTIVTQSLNPAGLVYLKVADETLTYNPLFFSFTPSIGGSTTPESFKNVINHPVKGDVWIGSSQTSTDGGGVNTVSTIRIARNDVNDIEVGPFIQVGTELEFIFTDASASDISGAVTYFVTGVTNLGDSIILTISSLQGDPTFASSSLGGQENWSLSASGTYNTDGVVSDTGDDFSQQGVFRNIEAQNQNQTFFYYNQTPMADPQGFFNTGSNTGRIEANYSTWGTTGAYNPLRTSNSPWFFSGSVTVSASLLEDAAGSITSSAAIHKSGSYEGVNLFDQDFVLGSTVDDNPRGDVFIPAPVSTDTLSANFFDATYNTQIPGNMSGSESQVGGHPKIKVGGTASLDFHFPALRIAGTFPSIIPPVPINTPLSGSDLATNRPNQDFATFTFPYNTWFYSGSSANNARAADGAIGFQWAQAAGEWQGTSEGLGKDPENIGEVSLTVSFDITASAPFTASLQMVEFEGPVPNGGGPITGSYTDIPGSAKFGYKSNSSNRVNQAGLSFTLEPSAFLDLNGAGIRSLGEYLRFALKPNVDQQQFEYRFDDFEISNATWEIYWFSDLGGGPTNGTSSYVQSFSTDGKPVDFTTYQNGQFGGINNQFTGSTISSGDVYPTVDINVLLKRTGSTSDGDDYDFIITSSKAQTFDVAEGASFHFTESPILDIKNYTGTGSGNTNTGSTINLANDMYYVEYSMSNFVPGVINGVATNTVNVDFTSTSDTGSLILISQSIDGGAAGFDLSGSLRILKSNTVTNPGTYGEEIIANTFVIPSQTTVDFPVAVTGSYLGNFDVNDTFVMNMEVSKSFSSGLVATDYTLKIFPSSSNFCKFDDASKMSSGSIALYNPILKVWNGPINNFKEPTGTQTILDTFFGGGALPFSLYTDGQPLLNNYSNQRLNTYLMDVDYNNTSGPIIPVNQELILSNSASRAAIPDSNYTQLRSIFPRYLGSRSSCKLYNVFSYGDTGTLGQVPNIDLRNAFFGYFNNIQNPYPNINNVIRLNVTQLIDEGGGALPPSLSGFSGTIFKEVFPLRSNASISVNSGSKELKGLEGQSTIFSVGNYPTPVCYSQTASNGHTSEIPLSGSGRISIYDNSGSAAAKTFYGMSAMGPGGDGTNSFPSSTFSTVLQPSEAVETSSYNTTTTTVTAPYIPNQGVFRFSSSIDATAGEDLKNPQQITVQTKVATGFIYESGGDEMELILRCVSGSTNIPFVFEDITLDAYYLGKKVNCGSLLGNVQGVDYRDGITVSFVESKGLFNNSSQVSFQDIARGNFYRNYESNTAVLDDQNRVRMLIENAGLNELLINKGVAWKDKGGVERGGTVEALEFTLKARTEVGFKAQDEIKFILEGTLREPNNGGNRANLFYPPSTPAEVVQFPTNFTVNGAYDDADGDNTASAPYWVYSQSVSKSIIEMSSSNFNEAYGTAWYQGQIPYIPGPSQYFEGGSEPAGTKFDPITSPLVIQAGDQIRFVNNENYTYNIIKVTDPSENIVSNPGGERVGRVKLELDGEIPTSVNKDFFLVRRPTTNANTVFINGDFPYANLITVENSSSGEVLTSGILYPDFPTNLISVSASSIVTNLISQGVIEP